MIWKYILEFIGIFFLFLAADFKRKACCEIPLFSKDGWIQLFYLLIALILIGE